MLRASPYTKVSWIRASGISARCGRWVWPGRDATPHPSSWTLGFSSDERRSWTASTGAALVEQRDPRKARDERDRLAARLVDSILVQVVREGTLTDAHQCCGVLFDATRVLERAANRLALDPLDVLPELERRRSGRLGRGGAGYGDSTRADHGANRQNHRPLYGVFQLPHVAGPVILLES